MGKFQIFIGPKVRSIGEMAGGAIGPTFETKEEADAYCEKQMTVDPNNQYIVKKIGNG